MKSVLALACLALLAGCAPPSVRLRAMLDEGDVHEVIEEGNAWLAETPPHEKPAERERVAVVIAMAELAQTTVIDKVEGYRAFRTRYAGAAPFAGVMALALEREAAAAWRDEASVADDADAYRRFREGYPDSVQIPEARRLEVARAFATAAPTLAAQRAFRDRYAGWPELEPFVERSRIIEVDDAFEQVRVRHDVNAWRGFRAAYADWPEAAPRLREAFEREARLALHLAEDSVEALRAFQADYPEPPWAERAAQALGRLVLRPLLAYVHRGEAPPDDAIAAFLDTHADVPGLTEVAQPDRGALLATALASGRSAPLRLARALFPADPELARLQPRERELAWQEALAEDTVDRWSIFFRHYPEDPRADEAEGHAFRLLRLLEAEVAWPRADVAWSRTLPSGEVELAVDVTDCEGRRVSGLTREAFEVHANGFAQKILDFKGLEEDRPLDVVFAIDLSGSMAAEQEAVRQAVMFFAEVFRFRGRQARLGLVTFAEQVAERRAPTGRVATFLGWMRALPATAGGGFGEDSTHALLASADLLKRAPGERVAILLTDEDLQANRGGQKALGVSSGAACARLQRAGACISKCTSAPCFARCYGQIGPAQRRAMDQCVRRYRAPLCVGVVDWGDLAQGLAACVEPVEDDSQTAERLAGRLASAGVRPFFLVPAADQTTGRAILGHHGVARQARGRVLEVPQDGESPLPYVHALADIADQLSKQYILRFRPADAAARAAGPVVIAGFQHAWSAQAVLPGPAVVALLPRAGQAPSCPALTLVLADGVHQTTDCGAAWRPLDLDDGPLLQAVGGTSGHPDVLVRTATALHAVSPDGDVEAVDTALPHLDDVALDEAGGRWLLGRDAEGALAIHHQAAGAASLRAVDQVQSPGPAAFLFAAGAEACALLSPTRRRCTRDGGQTWADAPSDGLDALAGPVRTFSVPYRPTTVLLGTADGALWRSLDAGARWRQVEPPAAPAAGGPAFVWLPGDHPTICASTPSAVRCSQDLGRTWASIGGGLDGPGALATVGGQLYLGREGALHRLDRVVSRDIPSSAVYFDTDQDEFDDRMRPFLVDLARRMARDDALALRVEGHADFRGGDAHNDDLALRRATRVAATVIAEGIDRDRVVTVGYGSRRPVRPGRSPDDLARNRRVELVLTRREPVFQARFDRCGRVVEEPAGPVVDEPEGHIVLDPELDEADESL